MADCTTGDDEPSEDSSADPASGAAVPNQASGSPITLVPVDHDPFASDASADPAQASPSGGGSAGFAQQYQVSPWGRPDQVALPFDAENMANPNYFKTVAPAAAEAIRDAVSANPALPKIIQFNSIATGAAGAGRRRDYQLVPVEHDPFQ